MKKILVLLAAMIAAILTSCRAEPPEPPKPPEEEFVEVWHTTQHYIKIEVPSVFPPFMKEEKKLQIERESIVSVSEVEEYRLSFREDGTGVGSGKFPDNNNNWRYNFGFEWQSSDDKLTITWDGNGSGWGGVFCADHFPAREEVVWNIEERTSDTMVLSIGNSAIADGIDGSAWTEEYTLRYTFKKVQ